MGPQANILDHSSTGNASHTCLPPFDVGEPVTFKDDGQASNRQSSQPFVSDLDDMWEAAKSAVELWNLMAHYSGVARSNTNLESLVVQLTFRHDCLNLGCGRIGCFLCRHNPKERCTTNFDKGFINEDLRAKCKAPIRVEVVNNLNGWKINQPIFDVQLEFFVIDGKEYDRILQRDNRCITEDELDSIAILTTRTGPMQQEEPQQLLISADPTVEPSSNWKVCVPLKGGHVELPALMLRADSEATFSSAKSPFRLVARAIATDGSFVPIQTVISEPFVIARKSAESSATLEYPMLDTPLYKLPYVDMKTLQKGADSEKVVKRMGILPGIPPHLQDTNTVGQLKELIERANQLPQSELATNLPKMLGVSKDHWPLVKELALNAIQQDTRPRAFFPPSLPCMGLLFAAKEGQVDISHPSALLTKRGGVLRRQQLCGLSYEERRALQNYAEHLWWAPGHAGWSVLDKDPPYDDSAKEGQGESAECVASVPAHCQRQELLT